MIKKTRFKIVVVVEAIITLVLFVVCALILVTSYFNLNFRVKESLSRTIGMLADNRPNPPPKSREFFVFITDILVIDYDNKFYSESEIRSYIDDILDGKNDFGVIKSITYLKNKRENMTIIVGVDTSIERGIVKQTMVYMFVVGILGLTLLGLIMWYLSKWIMDPISKNMLAQKVFISDASHELKTPITSIIANMSILEGENGVTKWSTNVINQAERLSLLSNELVTLSKLDENIEVERKNLNLSSILNLVILSFESIAYENDKGISAIIKDNVIIYANEIELNRLLSICIDNAIKHSLTNEKIIIKLDNIYKPVLSIYNKSHNINKLNKEKLFDRFYRGDNSRSRDTGGSGLGLSIAKKIIENNKWEVNIQIEENESIEFIIHF